MVNSCQHRQAPVNKIKDYQLVKGLPHGYKTGLVLRKVDAKKDADRLTPTNLQDSKAVLGIPFFSDHRHIAFSLKSLIL
jgi:hypothetical protein